MTSSCVKKWRRLAEKQATLSSHTSLWTGWMDDHARRDDRRGSGAVQRVEGQLDPECPPLKHQTGERNQMNRTRRASGCGPLSRLDDRKSVAQPFKKLQTCARMEKWGSPDRSVRGVALFLVFFTSRYGLPIFRPAQSSWDADQGRSFGYPEEYERTSRGGDRLW